MPPKPAKKADANGAESPAAVETEDASRDQSYFAYYAQLANQQNMLQDSVRTGMYQFAIMNNPANFKDKVRGWWAISERDGEIFDMV